MELVQSQGNKASQSNKGNHPILNLPEEIRGHVFNKLPQKDALNLRLVCKKWNEEIIKHFDFSIKFDERSPHCHQILGLRIRNLEIHRLMDYEYRIGNSTPDPTRQRPELIFQRPNFVQSLSIKQFEFDRGPNSSDENVVLPANVGELLSFFSKSLKSLCIEFSLKMVVHKIQPNSFYDFQNLETLRIGLDMDISVEWGAPNRADSIVAQLERSKFPNLKALNVRGLPRDFFLTLRTIIKIMNKNPRGLKRLGILLGMGLCHPDSTHVDQEDLSTLASVTNLEVITIKFRIIHGHNKIGAAVALLSDVIRKQRKLRVVNLCNLKTSATSFHVNPALLQWIIVTNFETLVSVTLDALNPEGSPIDLAVLKNCLKLTSLTLGMYEKSTAPISPEMSDLINFNDLPPNIINLSFKKFNILTVDLLSLLDFQTVQRSQTLELMNCGRSDAFGINSEVIQKIGHLKMIKCLKPVVHLEGFNGSDLQRFSTEFRTAWGRLQSGYLLTFSLKFVDWDKEPKYIVTKDPPETSFYD